MWFYQLTAAPSPNYKHTPRFMKLLDAAQSLFQESPARFLLVPGQSPTMGQLQTKSQPNKHRQLSQTKAPIEDGKWRQREKVPGSHQLTLMQGKDLIPAHWSTPLHSNNCVTNSNKRQRQAWQLRGPVPVLQTRETAYVSLTPPKKLQEGTVNEKIQTYVDHRILKFDMKPVVGDGDHGIICMAKILHSLTLQHSERDLQGRHDKFQTHWR